MYIIQNFKGDYFNLVNNEQEVIVSVVVLTYNHEKYIKDALKSIVAQKTSFNYEVLVGDDCSSDETLAILMDYQTRYPNLIKIFNRKVNMGATKNLSLLFKECSGKYIALLDGDDYWLNPNRLQILKDNLENSDFVCISHVRERRDMEGNLLGHDPEPSVVNKIFTMNDFLNGKRFSVTGSIFVNFFKDESTDYLEYIQATRNVADYQLVMCLLDLGDVYTLKDILGVYRVRGGMEESNYNSITTPFNQYVDHMKIITATENFFNGKYNLQHEKTERAAKAILSCIKHRNFSGLFTVISNSKQKFKVLWRSGEIATKWLLKKGE